jgi:putative ABC transport system permease protein
VSYLDYKDYRDQSDKFSDLAGYFINFVGLSADGRAERVTMNYVTSNFFPMLGVNALHGRVFQRGEGEEQGTPAMVVLGHTYWKRRFAGDPGVIGKAVTINGQPGTIIGVTPEWFHGAYALADMEVYLPLGAMSRDSAARENFTRRDNHDMRVIGRLKPGVTIKQANASLAVITKRLEAQYPDTNKTVVSYVFPENLARPEANATQQMPVVAAIFLSLAALVLLVACVNVANLMLVRGSLRQKELAIRAALGAGRTRLVRQLLTESLVLAILGGLAGVAMGRWVSSALSSIRLPADLPFRFDFSFDWRVFAYAMSAALTAGLIVGLMPALKASRANVHDALREGGRGSSESGKRLRARGLLVVTQVAGSLVLLVAAGLFVRSLGNAQTLDLGFDPRGVMNLSMDVAQQGYDEAKGKVFYRELEQRVKALPGVDFVSLAYSVPMGHYNNGDYVIPEGAQTELGKRGPTADYNTITPDYFKVMNIPLLRGRAFTEQDSENAPRVAIINEMMAEKFWPGQEAMGKRFRITNGKTPPIEIVGIAKNGKYSFIFDDIQPYFFLPQAQSYTAMRALQVRTKLPPETLATSLRTEVRALDPNLPVFDMVSMLRALDGGNGFFILNMGAIFAGALGLLGLALAVIGVYGVVSYSAAQRTQEIGIRLALGAQRGDILKMVLHQGLGPVGIGVGVGLGLAYLLSRAIQNMLFGISAHDPLTFAGVSLLLGLVAMAACLIPARRATRIDPIIALRWE